MSARWNAAANAARTLPRHPRLGLVAGLASGFAGGAALAVPPDYHAIAVSGQQVPGAPEGVVFEFLSSPRINNAGDVAFWARLGGPTEADPKAGSIWTANLGGALSRAVQGGDQTPFDPAFGFVAVFDPCLDEDGGVIFHASFADVPNPTHFTPAPSGNFAADALGPFGLGAHEGAAVSLPDDPGDVAFVGVMPGVAGAPGVVVFTGVAQSASTPSVVGRGLWAADENGAVPVAVQNQPAPGTPEGVTFFAVDEPAQGAPGSLIFRAPLRGGGAADAEHMGIWTDRSGALALLVRDGDAAPGAPAGSTFADFGARPVLSAAGGAVFAATIAGDGVTSENDTGLWTDRSGTLAALALEGEAAPGAGAGVEFASFSQHPAVNASSDVAFLAHLRGEGTTASDNSGIWLYANGRDPSLVVREGDVAFHPGVRYAVLHEPVINGRGQMAFLARLRGDEGAGVTPHNNFGLFVADPCGGVTPIVRTGTSFTFTPPAGGAPVTRQVAGIIFEAGAAAAGRSSLNDHGELLFTLRFDDGSGGLFGATVYRRADFSRDQVINSNDISAFLSAWLESVQQGTLAGDFDGSGSVNSNDISAFLNAWLAQVGGGC